MASDRLLQQSRYEGSGKTRTFDPANGTAAVVVTANIDRMTVNRDGSYFDVKHTGFQPLCSSHKGTTVSRRIIDAAGGVSAREIIAGGTQGFVDGSFEAPLGRLCGASNALAFADGRLYVSDQSNNAVRYLAVND